MKKVLLFFSFILFLFSSCKNGSSNSGSTTGSKPMTFPCQHPFSLPSNPPTVPPDDITTLSQNYKTWISTHPGDAIKSITFSCSSLAAVIENQKTLRLIPIAKPVGAAGNIALYAEIFKLGGVAQYFDVKICFPKVFNYVIDETIPRGVQTECNCPISTQNMADGLQAYTTWINAHPENVILQYTLDGSALTGLLKSQTFTLIPTADAAGNVTVYSEIRGNGIRWDFDIKNNCLPLVDSRNNPIFCPPPPGCSVNKDSL